MNSTIRFTFSGPSPIVTGRWTVPAARTQSPANPYSGVYVGVNMAPSIFNLENASIKITSAELPLSMRTRRTTMLATLISPTRASLCGWSSRSVSSSVKVIGGLS
ncbi:hypothetical protein TIFTF001_027579 [Ficus carica]|uniref:Uncharacterized protein n=1 Tax=Ficus carica TaxID=3494 RepID=A0AA88DNB2_FICCA|nr:hypothetical protein TIFTF001_027579 [Ficus carica]